MALKPPVRRGMKELDRSAFTLVLPVVGLRVPVKSIGQIKSNFPEDILKLPRMRNVVDDSNSSTHKLVLLNPKIALDLEKASDRLKTLISEQKWEPQMHDIQVGYDTWTADDILKAILPNSSQAPTSYEQIGHIAHMNLREEFWEYKKIIGQVILDKSPTVTMVVNKLDTIDNTFRNFKMEVLAGTPQFIAQVKENDCVFRFDYSKVYWNSRLHPEHERLVKKFARGNSICDVMAGVGPFAIPAAKQDTLVWANDLNPSSYEALCDNIQLNKVKDRVKPFNMDGRDFIRKAFIDYYQLYKQAGPIKLSQLKSNKTPIMITSPSFDHVVMNLPAIALEFLDAFRGLFYHMTGSATISDELNLPTIHVHCFTKSEEPEKDILIRACQALGFAEDKYQELDAQVFYVRKVAPNKDMYCLSLKLPQSVAYATDTEV
ncbi:tRNA(m(1)G37)methyltransferase [Coemansia brasiliensis]|uniref:tRNA (guanine(37)-N1)-methyltransferase n=1 Tax=Coemansia brasiliensis TaxID=2650707 RepID=A0A9W8I9J5_9FUNG|nr:tRNA(m(1)G37)methyltransferase [Coemansia brasiliensis]